MKRRVLPPLFFLCASAAPLFAQTAPVRGDYLARMLQGGPVGVGMLVAGLAVAFGLGAVHALSPGHGKTIVEHPKTTPNRCHTGGDGQRSARLKSVQ